MKRPKKTAENKENNNNNNNNKLNYNKTNNSYRRRQHINSYSSASTWYDATVCKYTCMSFLIFSACCSICIIGITFIYVNYELVQIQFPVYFIKKKVIVIKNMIINIQKR